MDDSDAFDETYKDSSYVMLVFTYDGSSGQLTLKGRVFGASESGTIGVKKQGRTYTFSMGVGTVDYDEDQLPNPIKRLVGGGSGPYAPAMDLPPPSRLIRSDYTPVSYGQYTWKAIELGEPILPRELFQQLVKWYLDVMGVPLYL